MKTKIPFKVFFRISCIILLLFAFNVAILAQETGEEYYALAEKAEDKENYEQAIMYYLQAAAQYEKEEDLDGAAWSYFEAGEIYLEKLRNYESAYTNLEKSRQSFEKDGNSTNVSFAGLIAGYAKYKLKQYAEAATIFASAGETAVEAEAFGNAGFAYDGAGHAIKYSDWTDAQTYWNLAKDCFNMDGESYTIPPELQIEIETPADCNILVGFFYTKMDEFQQGEAIKISGQLLQKGKPVQKGSPVKIEVFAPDCSTPYLERLCKTATDDKGQFSIMPFAGWKTGNYKLALKGEYTENGKISQAYDTVYFNVDVPDAPDFTGQLANIIKYYNDAIPPGPIRTNILAQDYLASSFGINIDEEDYMSYGYLHNHFLSGLVFDYDGMYTCVGYQKAVTKFLDMIRFNDDPEIRKLMSGLDYGPIERGYGGWNHAAVVLYTIGQDWWSDDAVVLDPWFTQYSTYYSMKEWRRIGIWKIKWYPDVDRNATSDPNQSIWRGFPIGGNYICSNYENSYYFGEDFNKEIPKYKFLLKCPVSILITDSAGNRTGVIEDETFVQEFSANIHCFRDEEDEEDITWYVELPDSSYKIHITGLENGIFEVLLVNDTISNEQLLYMAQSIIKGETATITLGPDIDKPTLILPDGTEVEPISEPVGIDKALIKNQNNIVVQNHPNPFSETTLISYHLPRNTHVKLEVFDISGKKINTLMNVFQNAGEHNVSWNGTDESGTGIQSGIYFYKITTDNYAVTKKMFVIR